MPMTTFITFVSNYIASDHAMQAVLIPLTLSIASVRVIFKNFQEFLFFTICTLVSYFCSRWEVSLEATSLYIIPFVSFFIPYTAYKKWLTWSPLKAFAWTFFSVFIVDCYRALDLIETSFDWGVFYGVGGAGFKDGLFIFPIMMAVLAKYIAARQKSIIQFEKLI